MSMIYSTITILLLVSASLAIRAPAVVYSAVIYNTLSAAVECSVVWSQPSGESLQSGLFTIKENNYHAVHQKEIKMPEGWTARAEISEIHCGKQELKAPFQNVKSPQVNWEFRVEADQIDSVGPSSIVVDN